MLDHAGKAIHKVASLPLEEAPIDGVPEGPRNVTWRPTEPATLVWVEALDGGDPKKNVPHRDRILMLRAPFQGQSAEVARTEHRSAGIQWLETGGRALIGDYDRDKRWIRTKLITVDSPSTPSKQIWSRSIQDRYNDPGTPVMKRLPNGQSVVP